MRSAPAARIGSSTRSQHIEREMAGADFAGDKAVDADDPGLAEQEMEWPWVRSKRSRSSGGASRNSRKKAVRSTKRRFCTLFIAAPPDQRIDVRLAGHRLGQA